MVKSECHRHKLIAKGTTEIFEKYDGSAKYIFAGTFLKLGILPINYEIDLRKLKFLWRILQKDYTDPVRQVYLELKTN